MDAINRFFKDYPMLGQIISLLASIIVAVVILFFVFRAQKKVVARLAKNKKASLNTRMIENGFRFLMIFLAVQWIMMSSDLTKNFGQSLFQGTAVLAAIAGFAAQSVLSDILCGLMVSSTEPFDIGNRIPLENGTSGIGTDMTLRHVVLRGLDSQVYVIPNSRMNSQQITNMSWHSDKRSVDFRFHVSYASDPDTARAVIRQAIIDSPLSVPGKPGSGSGEYADVYFLDFLDTSLLMGTTAYYLPGTSTEAFKTDINTRVKKALEANNIEIPYPYINVQMKS